MIFGAALASTLILQRRFDPEDTLRGRWPSTGPRRWIVVPGDVPGAIILDSSDPSRPLAILTRDTGVFGGVAPSAGCLWFRRVMDTFGDTPYNL